MRYGDRPDARPYTLLMLLLETGMKGVLRSISITSTLRIHRMPLFLFATPTHAIAIKNASFPYQQWVEVLKNMLQQYALQDRLFPLDGAAPGIHPRGHLSRQRGFEKRISFDMCRWTTY